MAIAVGPAPTTRRSSSSSMMLSPLSLLPQVEMIDRPMPIPGTQGAGRRHRSLEVLDGALNGAGQILPGSQTGGDRRRKSAAGAVRRPGAEPRMSKPVHLAFRKQKIDHLVSLRMPALG